MIQDFIHETRFRLGAMLEDRRPLDGILGLPALMTLLLLVLLVLHPRLNAGAEQTTALEQEARAWLDKGRFVEARIAAARLTQEGSRNPGAVLIEARALRGMGREMEAARLLARLAPLERPGHAPAHVMQAAILLAQKQPDFQTALQHMNNALQSEPDNADALELAARFAAGRNDWKTVLRHLDRMEITQRPDLLLMRATALQFTGLHEDSIRCARLAETALRAIHDPAAPGAGHVRSSIAVSLGLQRRFEEAIQWMQASLHQTPTAEERQVIAGLYLSWSRHLRQQPAPDRMRALELLEQGLQISPESQDLIMAFLGDCEELPGGDSQRQQLISRVLGGGGIASAFMHYHLGVQDWKSGDKQSARSHFELASSLNPGFGIISNNLAMAIASVSDSKDELEKALVMMNGLVGQNPGNPFYLDTRGHLLARLGLLKDALRDFEQSLPASRDKASAHRKIAGLYQRLNMPDIAAEHHRQSITLTTTQPAARQPTSETPGLP